MLGLPDKEKALENLDPLQRYCFLWRLRFLDLKYHPRLISFYATLVGGFNNHVIYIEEVGETE
jgi:hypothetical protein